MDRKQERPALYIYDRVCTKRSKVSEISSTYGYVPPRKNGVKGASRQSERIYGKEFVRSQKQRAYDAGFKINENEYRRNENAYQYRPGAAEGGEAVSDHSNESVFERLSKFFESIDEKGRRDEAIARKRAVAWKKLYEYKHILFTAFVLLAITIAFILLVYKIFFVVENVEITGSDMYSESEILLSAGIEIGDNLYSFAGDDAEAAITFMCPYIRSAEIDRTVPKSVAVALEEDTAAYYAVIWGDCVKLSEGLRVLETVDGVGEEEGLIELILPPVRYSVAGRVIEFADKRDERFIRNVLSEMKQSALAASGMIDQIDLSDEYGITVESMGRYLLKMGDETDFDLKLRMGYKTMTSDQFDDLLPARIDLSEVGRAAILPDASLVLGD